MMKGGLETEELEKEVERLKKLIEKAHREGWLNFDNYDKYPTWIAAWEHFKQENEL